MGTDILEYSWEGKLELTAGLSSLQLVLTAGIDSWDLQRQQEPVWVGLLAENER